MRVRSRVKNVVTKAEVLCASLRSVIKILIVPRAAAGFPTQVLAEVGNMLGLRLRELPTEQYNCFVKNEVCRLIVADGMRRGGDKSKGAAAQWSSSN